MEGGNVYILYGYFMCFSDLIVYILHSSMTHALLTDRWRDISWAVIEGRDTLMGLVESFHITYSGARESVEVLA